MIHPAGNRHPRRRPGRSALRTLQLVAGSLAVVGMGFVIYRMTVDPLETSPSSSAEMPEAYREFLESDGSRASGITIDGVGVQAQERSAVTILDKDTLEKRVHMTFDQPQQVDNAGRQFRVRNPVITYYMAKGEQAVIRADQALLTSGRVDEIDLQKGRFQGNVRIDVDRRTSAWRQEHPDQAERPPRRDQVVRLWMEDMSFDRELGTLHVPEDVRIESSEVTLDGRGLRARWSERSGQLEFLRLEQGRELLLGGGGAGLELSSGWSAPAAAAPEPLEPEPSVAVAPAPETLPEIEEALEEGTLVLDVSGVQENTAELSTYRIELQDQVVARQLGTQDGELLAEHLQVLLDVRPGGAPSEPTGAPSEEPPVDEPEEGAAEPAAEPGTLRLTWNGPLEIRALDPRPAEAGRPRQQLMARGTPVIVRDRSGSARSAELTYHRETGYTDFVGGPGLPIDIDGGEGFRLRAAEQVTLDRVARTTHCRGDVQIRMDDLDLRGQIVDATFRAPTAEGQAPRDLLDKLECRQQVALRTRSDTIRCRNLTVHFHADEAGRNIPRHALALEDIEMTQGSRRFSADRSIAARFGDLPTDEAGRVTGDTPVIRSLSADGAVHIVDPLRAWDIAGDHLDCRFDDQQVVTYGYIEGPAGGWARVEMGAYAIHGATVTFDDANSWAHVPGAGRARFAVKEDLDGRRSEKPVPIEVTWTREMTLRGHDNLLMFDGEAVARSEENTLEGDILRITLEDLPPPVVEARDPAGMWFLRPYEAEVRLVGGVLGVDPPSTDAPQQRLRKRAIHVLADGNAKLQSRSALSDDRLRSLFELWGPQIAIDLQTRRMVIEGPGDLLIQDYPTAEMTAVAHQQPSEGGLLSDVRSEGPSQTAIGWDAFMRYDYLQRVAEFESRTGPVKFAHRSGQHIVLDPDLVAATGVTPEQLSLLQSHGRGRRSDLSARRLLVEFSRAEGPGRRGAGEMSTGQLRQFQASGDVVLVDERYYVTGQRIDFVQDTQLISVYGAPGDDAYVSVGDPRGGARREARCPELHLELKSGHIDAPCRVQASTP